MKQNFQRYILVTGYGGSSTLPSLETLVTQLLQDGWILYGSPAVCSDDGVETFIQAMVLSE